MLVPINEILEELVSDFATACGEQFQYLFREKTLGPGEGLYIDISEEWITVHGRLDSDEVIFSDTYRRTSLGRSIDYDILLAGLIFFYRLIGSHLGIEENLAKYSVSMTEQFVSRFTTGESEIVTLSFKDGKSWIDVSRLLN